VNSTSSTILVITTWIWLIIFFEEKQVNLFLIITDYGLGWREVGLYVVNVWWILDKRLSCKSFCTILRCHPFPTSSPSVYWMLVSYFLTTRIIFYWIVLKLMCSLSSNYFIINFNKLWSYFRKSHVWIQYRAHSYN